MRNWKKYFTFAILLLISSITFFACGSKSNYDNMFISVETIGLTVDDNGNHSITYIENSDNLFTLKVSVNGAGSGVSTDVEFDIGDKGLIAYHSKRKVDNVTTFVFKVDPGKESSSLSTETTIRFTTTEGNKTYDQKVKVEIPFEHFMVYSRTIPVVKGQVVNLDTLNNFYDYVPSNTTQRGVTYGVDQIGSVLDDDINYIKNYLTEHKNKIYIPTTSDLQSFYLTVTSNHKSVIDDLYKGFDVLVIVLDKDPISEFSLTQGSSNSEEDGGENESDYPLLTQDGNGKYKLMLVNNSDRFFNYRQAIVNVLFGGAPLSEKTFSYPVENNNSSTEEDEAGADSVEQRLYSVYIENLVYDGKVATLDENGCIKFIDNENETEFIEPELKMINAKPCNDAGDSFLLSQATITQGTCEIVLLIDFYGYEGMYAPIQIPVEVSIVTFPSELRLYDSKVKLDDLTSQNSYDFDNYILKDYDLVVYHNSDGTFFRVAVWGDSIFIPNQAVTIEVNSPNISIKRGDDFIVDGGQTIQDCQSGDLLKIIKTGSLIGDIYIRLTSSVYTELSKEIRIKYFNDKTELSSYAGANYIALDYDMYKADPTTYNRPKNNFFDDVDGIAVVSNIPTHEDGSLDYSVMQIEVENGKKLQDGRVGQKNSYVEIYYSEAERNWVLIPFNKIGSTNIVVIAPNGLRLPIKLYIYYPFEENGSEFFKLQIANFENFVGDVEDEKFKFVFPASTSREEPVYKTQLLVGEEYSYYYLLGEQQYYDLTGILTINTPYNPMPSCIEIDTNNRVIRVRDYTSSKIQIVFSFTSPIQNLDDKSYPTYYITIDVTLEKIVETITTEQHSLSLYTLDSLGNKDVKIEGSQDETYHEKYGYKTITLNLYPLNATTKYEIDWYVGDSNGNLFSLYTDPKKDNNGNIIEYVFSYGNSQDPLIIVLNPSIDRTSVTVSVKTFGSDNNLKDDPVLGKNVFDFVVYSHLSQSFIASHGEKVVQPLSMEIDVHVENAGSVNQIYTPNIYNNRVTLDIRAMIKSDNGEYYVGNNSFEVEYELLLADSRLNLLNKDITVYTPNDSDIKVSKVIDENTGLVIPNVLNVEYLTSTSKYIKYPEYVIYIVANNSATNKLFSGEVQDIYNNISSCYKVVEAITIRIANGGAIDNIF